MSDRPPSPPTPPSPQPAAIDADGATDTDRIVATTPQLVDAIEGAFGCRLDDGAVEEFLVELDRQHVVEWVTVTRSGTVVWDLTNTPDRVSDAIATAVTDRLVAWVER